MKSLLATLIGATLLATVPAHAATDLYLKINGVKGGESTMKGYEGQIEVLSWSWGVSNTGTSTSGPGNVYLGDLSWTQHAGASMVDLFSYLTSTDPDHRPGMATLSAVSTGSGGYNYFQAEFNNNLITSMSTGGSGGENRLTASFSMSMGEVALRYRPTSTSAWAEARYVVPAPGVGAVFSGDPKAFEGLSMAMAPAQAVPEPASWALMLGGMLITGAALRRRLPR